MSRLRSIDALRGIVMVLMALDHVRWFVSDARFNPVDLSVTTAPLFMTRWVTHLCAPVFLFLVGVSAFLYGARGRGPGDVARFLATRGVWLIVVEMTVVRFGWFFNVQYDYLFAGVIWVIGWCMLLMAPMVFLPRAWIATIGLGIVFLHNAVGGIAPDWGAWSGLRTILYDGGPVTLPGGVTLGVLYAIFPWIGVVAAGYAFGPVFLTAPAKRDRTLLATGLAMIALFALLRLPNLYGDPDAWAQQASFGYTLLSILNTDKYPASLLFLLMTLGPMIALTPALERWGGRLNDAVVTFGRVPFFYYVLHLPLIHGIAVVLSIAATGSVAAWLTANPPPVFPDGYGYSLWVVYGVWIMVCAILYVPCRWFARVKKRNRSPWLSYL